jgi:hypothetical protein
MISATLGRQIFLYNTIFTVFMVSFIFSLPFRLFADTERGVRARIAAAKLTSALLCVVAFASSSCADEPADERPIELSSMTHSVPFVLPEELHSFKTDIRRVDMRRTGYEDALVTVFPKDSLGAKIGFEALKIYEYDTTKKAFTLLYEDKFYYGKSIDPRDVDGDDAPELCVQTDGGGNSAVASVGLIILKKQRGKYRRLASFEAGNPEIVTLASEEKAGDNPDGKQKIITAVVSSDEYWPDYLPRTEAVTTLDSVVILTAKTSEEALRWRMKFWDDYLAKAQQRYAEAKSVLQVNRSPEAVWNVYAEAIVVVRSMAKSSASARVATFAAQERPFWRAMLPKRFQQALDAAVEKPKL